MVLLRLVRLLLKAADLPDSAGCSVAGAGSRLAPPPPPLRSASFVRYALTGPLRLLFSRLLLIRPQGSNSLLRLRAPTDYSSGIRNRPPHFSGLGKSRCALVGVTHAFPSKPSYAALLSVFRGCRAEHPNGLQAEQLRRKIQSGESERTEPSLLALHRDQSLPVERKHPRYIISQ